MLHELYKMENVEIMETKNGKDFPVTEGFGHHLFRRSDVKIAWWCYKTRSQKCEGTIKTHLKYEITENTEHSCAPCIAQIDINRKMRTCRKRVREEISVPVKKIFKEEISGLYEKGYDLVANIPKYENVKSALS